MPVPVQKRDETRFNFPVTFPHMSTHTWVLVLWSSTTSHYSQQSTSPLVLAGIQVSAPPRSAGYKLRARKVSRKIDSLSSLLTTTPLQRTASCTTSDLQFLSCRLQSTTGWCFVHAIQTVDNLMLDSPFWPGTTPLQRSCTTSFRQFLYRKVGGGRENI